MRRTAIVCGSGHSGGTGSCGTRVVTFGGDSAGAKTSGHHLFYGSLEKFVSTDAHIIDDFESTLVLLVVNDQVEFSSS